MIDACVVQCTETLVGDASRNTFLFIFQHVILVAAAVAVAVAAVVAAAGAMDDAIRVKEVEVRPEETTVTIVAGPIRLND